MSSILTLTTNTIGLKCKRLSLYNNRKHKVIFFSRGDYFMPDEIYTRLGFVMSSFSDLHDDMAIYPKPVKTLNEFKLRYYKGFTHVYSITDLLAILNR